MITNAPDLVGLGYEGHDIASFMDRVAQEQVSLMVAVRLNPISRKTGFSKRGVASALEQIGIPYVHLRSLGNPRDNRPGFAELHSEQARGAREQYRSLLNTPEAERDLAWVRAQSQSGRVGLLCFEADEMRCHRRVVMDLVAAEIPVV